MATDAQTQPQSFGFHSQDLRSGDQYRLEGQDGQHIDIVITDIMFDGSAIYGMAVQRDGSWCAPLGRIKFNGPVVAGEQTIINFNMGGMHRTSLRITPQKLGRTRDHNFEVLFET